MSEVLSQSTEDLAIKLADLKIQETEPYLSEARKLQIRKEMAYLSFELEERAKDA